MPRVLVVAHSANFRDTVLWREVLHQCPSVDLVVPALVGEEQDMGELAELLDSGRVRVLRAIEPVGRGHASMWMRGILSIATPRNYDLAHVAFEPWAALAQSLCGRIPTVVQGAESVVSQAPRTVRMRRVGLRRVLRKAAGVATWGQTSLDAFREVGIPRGTPCAVIPMGIPDPAVFRSTPMDLACPELRILYVGRLVPEKGVLTLAEAAGQLESQVTVRLLGDGPLRERLSAAQASTKTLRLEAAGPADLDEVVAAMTWAHVVVVPSETTERWMEQWGRVVVESMLSGRPTLVSDSGELPHLITDPSLVFPSGSVADLAARLRHLNRNRSTLPGLGERLRLEAHRFEPSVLAPRLIEFWDESYAYSKTR